MLDVLKGVAISAVGIIAGVALGAVLVDRVNKEESTTDSSETSAEAQPEAE